MPVTLEETAKIMRTIVASWPAFLNGRDPELTTKIWQRAFEYDSYETVAQALFAYLSTDTSGFAPMPGQLRKLMAKFATAGDHDLDAMQAWTLVHNACRTDGLYHSQEAFNALPEAVRRVVRDHQMLRTWALMDEDQVQTVVASNFQRAYRAQMEDRDEWFAMPEKLRNILPCMAEAVKLAEPEAAALPDVENESCCEMPDWFLDKAESAADEWEHNTAAWQLRRLTDVRGFAQ